MRRPKVLLVSLGSIGLRHLRNTRELLPQAEIAIFRQHSKGNTETPEFADLVFVDEEQALEFKPEAVIISSPASEHIRNAELFIKAGANIFLEKPLADSTNKLNEFSHLCSQSKSFVMVGYVLRFQPMLEFFRGYLHSGQIGKVLTARVEVGQYLPDWRPNGDYRKGVSAQKALGGGAILELSHEIDYATWIFGKPDSVICSAGKLSDLEIDVEDSANIAMEYTSERPYRRVVLQLDFLQRSANMAVQVVGTEGTLYADLIKETLSFLAPGKSEPEPIEIPKLKSGNEMYLRQFDFFFAQSIQGYQQRFAELKSFSHWVDVQQASMVMDIVEKAKESNRLGQRLYLKGGVNG